MKRVLLLTAVYCRLYDTHPDCAYTKNGVQAETREQVSFLLDIFCRLYYIHRRCYFVASVQISCIRNGGNRVYNITSWASLVATL
jgi:hypothetical protein